MAAGLRVVCTGLIGSIPMAGLSLHYLQYVLGLQKLGHDVLYLEDTGTWNYDPDTDSMTDDVTRTTMYLGQLMSAQAGTANWVFVDHRDHRHGPGVAGLDEFLNSADLFINVTGAGILRDEYMRIPRRLYVDTDPGFIQLRVAEGNEKDIAHLESHTHHFSFGCNIGKPGCAIPPGPFAWIPTRQPIAEELWPLGPSVAQTDRFTTVLKWQTYDPVEHDGESYGLKNEEFLKFIDLPAHTGATMELAMAGDPPSADLRRRGWVLQNARAISDTVANYRAYIQGSGAEWSIAKNGYVKTSSGWFSDRSAAYLASGRPVVLQSTGYEQWLPTGAGLQAFSNLAEALQCIEEVRGRYTEHSRAARALALDMFRAEDVLLHMLDDCA